MTRSTEDNKHHPVSEEVQASLRELSAYGFSGNLVESNKLAPVQQTVDRLFSQIANATPGDRKQIMLMLARLSERAPLVDVGLDYSTANDTEKLGYYTLECVSKNISLITAEIMQPQSQCRNEAYFLLKSLLDRGLGSPIRSLSAFSNVTTFLLRHEALLLDDTSSNNIDIQQLFWLYYFRSLDKQTSTRLQKWLVERLGHTDEQWQLSMVDTLLSCPDLISLDQAKEIVWLMVRHHVPQMTDAEFSTLWAAWKKSVARDNQDTYLTRNLRHLFALEKKQTNVYRFFMQKPYYVCNFGRYPIEVLWDMYKYRHDKKSAHGVAVFPYKDPKGAFYQEMFIFSSLRTQLANLGDIRLRIYECHSIISVARALISEFHNYGKINFGILGGHGQWHSIELDDNQHISVKQILLGQSIKRAIRNLFVPNPSIVALSCNAAQKDKPSIMRHIAQLGTTATGYEESTYPTGIQAWQDHSNVRLSIDCAHGPSRTYDSQGKLIENNPPQNTSRA